VCNPSITQQAANCKTCGNGLFAKRKITKGGNGLCSACEQQQIMEAVANGSTAPLKSQRWEDYVLEQLIPKVVDADTGVPFEFEMRDSMTHMLGSNTKRRRDECDTTKQRRPDILWLKRDPEHARIVAVLKVGIDEHSHAGYDPACESGKIDDQFQALQHLAAREGASHGASSRHDARMVYCNFLKFNPNACDVSPPIKLADRIDTLASACNRFLNTPADEFQKLSDVGEADIPHVQCFYYHSEQGRSILDHFDSHAPGAWDWRGNVLTVKEWLD
jgi:hypothetical protein